jgi:hypothetical protein
MLINAVRADDYSSITCVSTFHEFEKLVLQASQSNVDACLVKTPCDVDSGYATENDMPVKHTADLDQQFRLSIQPILSLVENYEKNFRQQSANDCHQNMDKTGLVLNDCTSCCSPRIKHSRVTFSKNENDKELVMFHTVLSRHDYTPEERQSVWWSSAYLKTFKDSARFCAWKQRMKNQGFVERCLLSSYQKACEIVLADNTGNSMAIVKSTFELAMMNPHDCCESLIEWSCSSNRQVAESHGLERSIMTLLNTGSGCNSVTLNNNRCMMAMKSRSLVLDWSKSHVSRPFIIACLYEEHCRVFALLARMNAHADMIAIQQQHQQSTIKHLLQF